MTAIVFLIALMLAGQVTSEVVELSCSDNATCIDSLARSFVRSIRAGKTVKLFDLLMIEPTGSGQARSNQGVLSKFLSSHAFSFDWNDLSFRLTKPEARPGVVDLEVFESRTAKDVSEEIPKKSNSKVEEEGEAKRPKRLRRRHRKKVLQAVIPLVFGMKSAGSVMFAMAMVTVLTLKAYLASKLALMVTVGMALKRLYETYSTGVGLQNHPYLYSQYPIDFPSASSHAYSVSGGVSPQFGSPEMYNPSALSHNHEMLQPQDASAQQSQQAPTLQLVNATRASERWDGKSTIQKLIEPVIDGFRSFIDPIASVFMGAMPVTFRGLSSDVSTAPVAEASNVEETVVAKEILVPQPRTMAQRKTTSRKSVVARPKKYSELKVDLDRLKQNKDFDDYVRTKKYKFNYPNTFYYPRVKHFVNPHSFYSKPNNSRLIPYRKPSSEPNINVQEPLGTKILKESSDWQPILVLNVTETKNEVNKTKILAPKKPSRKAVYKKRPRIKREVTDIENRSFRNASINNELVFVGRTLNDYIDKQDRGDYIGGFLDLVLYGPIRAFFTSANKYTEKVIKNSLKSKDPPQYYSFAYNMLMLSLEVIDGFVNVENAMKQHITGSKKKKIKKKPMKKPMKKPTKITSMNSTSKVKVESRKKRLY